MAPGRKEEKRGPLIGRLLVGRFDLPLVLLRLPRRLPCTLLSCLRGCYVRREPLFSMAMRAMMPPIVSVIPMVASSPSGTGPILASRPRYKPRKIAKMHATEKMTFPSVVVGNRKRGCFRCCLSASCSRRTRDRGSSRLRGGSHRGRCDIACSFRPLFCVVGCLH